MKTAIYSVPLDKNGQEILQRGKPLFPCSVYKRDIRQYISGEITPHWHNELELFVLEAGSAHISLIDSEFDIQPGEGYFVNSNVLHGVSCYSDEGCRYRSIVFDPIIVSGAPGSAFDMLYVRPLIEHGSPVWILREEHNIIELFDKAYYACEKESEGYEFSVRDALSQILLLLRKNLQEKPSKISSQQEIRMKQMISWLDEHYSKPVTISQLAIATGLCVRECQKIFANLLHISPMQYLMRRRISAAADFLENTDLPVSEIGMRCGFDNPSYFAKQFKEILGVSPREYRRQHITVNQCKIDPYTKKTDFPH